MSSEIETAQALGVPMLKALGIDSKHVLGFSINCEVGEVPTLTLKRFLPRGVGEAVKSVLEKYRLEPVTAISGPDLDESVSLDTLVRTTHRPACSPGSDRT